MPCTPPNAAERLVLADDRRNTVNSPFLMAGNSEDATLFIGSWTLLSYQLRLPSGAVEKPMGERPRGRILYLKNGQMSAQVTASGLDSLVNEDSRDATPEEAVHAWRNYIGYWGTYAVDAAAGLVIHSVEGAWFRMVPHGSPTGSDSNKFESTGFSAIDSSWKRVRPPGTPRWFGSGSTRE